VAERIVNQRIGRQPAEDLLFERSVTAPYVGIHTNLNRQGSK